jgi:magnesium chelatase subunit I
MKEAVEQVAVCARRSKHVDQQSGVSARFSIATYKTMVASARQRGIRLGERPSVVRMSDLAHFVSSAVGKLELDLLGTHQLSERQVLEGVCAEATKVVFEEYVTRHGLEEIAQVFAKGVKVEVGDMLPSGHYEKLLRRVPAVWDKAFEVNAAGDAGVRASCVEFVLAGLYASDKVSRAVRHGRLTYET